MPSWNTGSITARTAISGDDRIAALQSGLGSSEHWAPGQPITYSFPAMGALFSGGQDYGNGEIRAGWLPLSPEQQQAVRAALSAWAAVAHLPFVEVPEAQGNVGELRFAITVDIAKGAAAHAYLPTSGSPEAGDIWLTSDWQGMSLMPDNFQARSYDTDQHFALSTLIHEIGHALGLGHPFGHAHALPEAQDHVRNTLMSYTNGDEDVGFMVATTPMPYDILAIQYLYGANLQFAADDTVWTFDMADANLSTIWDAGGTDTLRISNHEGLPTYQLAEAPWSVIDLAEGAGSRIGFSNGFMYQGTRRVDDQVSYPYYGLSPNVYIAFGAVIENAVGSAGPDVIYGNAHDNRLDGGGDRWQDQIDGREGLDTAVYAGQFSDYLIARAGPLAATGTADRADIHDRVEYTVTRLGTTPADSQDWLVNIERLEFSDLNVALDLQFGDAAATAVGLATALRGPQALSDMALMGELIRQADLQDARTLAQMMVDSGTTAALAGGSSDADLVQLLYRNVIGQAPSEQDREGIVSYAQAQGFSQADIVSVIAGLAETFARADLVGLQQHGLTYLEHA